MKAKLLDQDVKVVLSHALPRIQLGMSVTAVTIGIELAYIFGQFQVRLYFISPS